MSTLDRLRHRAWAVLFTLAPIAIGACSPETVPASTDAVETVPLVTEAEDVIGNDPAPLVEEAELAPAVTELPPNELGEIMVLEYHRLGEPENDYHRSAESFRNDLRRLYDQGYRPITVQMMARGEIDLPRGATPVIFTIDDSSRGQLYLREDGSVDPGTMLGMWDAFARENSGWSGGATWCVLPAADHPSNFFGERPSREVPRAEREETIRRKLELLVEGGHEICNHTLYHARLDRARDAVQVQEWIGRGEDSIRIYLPQGAEITTLSLPLGMWPAERSLAWRGTYQGRTYEYNAVLEVTGGPNESPFDQGFDRYSIKRVVMAPNALERLLTRYAEQPDRRFVSDGDPKTITVPADLADRVARDRWPELDVRLLEEPAGGAREE